jgi:hypothetical protein
MKKIIRVTVVAEIEVDTDMFADDITDEGIKNIEGENWPEWITDILCDIKSEKIEIFDPEDR